MSTLSHLGPVRRLTCCCCGGDAGRFHQHYNRDTGFGMCAKCIAWVKSRGMSDAEILDLYGVEGIHYAGNNLMSGDTNATEAL